MAETIHTKRLRLRPYQVSDAGRVFALFADWRVIRWLSSPPWPYSVEDARSFVTSQAAKAEDFATTTFAILLDGVLIGAIDLDSDLETPDQPPMLGYWLGYDYWRNGYMSEAAAGFLGRAFVLGAAETIRGGAFADNAASQAVQRKLGFAVTGETMLYARPRGERRRHVEMMLTREDFARTQFEASKR